MMSKHEEKKNTTKKTKKSETEDIVFEEEEVVTGGAQAKVKKLQAQLKECQKERQEYLDGWQRAKADFINARKEDEKKRAETIRFANKELVLEILAVADSFDMAFANKEAWEKVDKNWRTGVEYIYSQLLTVLEQQGLKRLNPMGEEFDPNVHTSVETVDVDKKEDDHKIVDIVQGGYMMHDTLLRSPKVKVGVYKN